MNIGRSRVLHMFHVISGLKYDVLLGSGILEAFKAKIDMIHDTSRNVKFFIYRDEVEIDNKFYIE